MELPSNVYVSGKMEEMNCGWDVNVVSCMDISKLIESLGYSDFKSLYYHCPKLALSRGESRDAEVEFKKEVTGW